MLQSFKGAFMANDFYINEEPEDDTSDNWGLLEQEFHEWDVFNNITDIVAYKGLPSVLSTILEIMKQKGIQ